MTLAYERFLNYFKKMGRERIDGLDRSYFEGMTNQEKDKSFDFLLKEFQSGSSEAVEGLRAHSGEKILNLFLDRIAELRDKASLIEQRLSLSVSLWQMSGDIQYQDDMIEMLEHQDEFIRAFALSALDQTPTSVKLVRRLEKICIEESTELIVQAAAQQLLKRHGITLYDRDKADSYRSIYKQLKSGDIDEIKLGLSKLDKR